MSPGPTFPRFSRPTTPTATTLGAVAVLSAATLAGCGESEADNAATTMLPTRISDWVQQDSVTTYDRETIFDYIDGAGEVYRSYAFNDVVVAQYDRSGSAPVTVEVFDMGSSDDAYGVFSYAREQQELGIGGGFERKGRVLCFWQDRFYVCVAAELDAADPETEVEAFAQAFSQQLPAPVPRPAMVDLLPSEGLVAHSVRFFHLHQSLNYHYYLARENVLELNDETDVVLARYTPGSIHLLIVRYASEADAARGHTAFRERYLQGSTEQTVLTEGGKYVSSRSRGRFVAVVLDADSEVAAESLLQATTNRVADFAR